MRQRFAWNSGPALVHVTSARCYETDTGRATRSIGGRPIIVKPLDAFAGALPIPTGHSAAKGTLAMKQERGRNQREHRGRANGNSF
jgi:hypothetical protein